MRAIIILTIATVLTGCVKDTPIEEFLNQGDINRQIVVEAIFTNELKRHEVALSFSKAASELNEEILAVSGADVSILSSSNDLIEFVEIEPGIYLTVDSVQGVVSESYTLIVEYENAIYEGTDEMLPITSHDPIELTKEVDGFYSIPYRPHQFGYDEPNRYDLKVFIPDSLWTETFENVTKNRVWTYYTHPFFEPNGVFEFVATDFKVFGNHNTYYMQQKKYSISDRYYEFLRAVFSETEWRGSLLDTNPGNIPTNMSQISGTSGTGIIGFFATCEVNELIYKYPDPEF